MQRPPEQDAFPATMTTWIVDALDNRPGGRADVNHHIMDVYAWPLRVYFLGTRDRYLGDPDEVVQGFFADRLSKKDFFADWRASGLPLRRWLINGFCFYLKELRRRLKRDTSETLGPGEDQAATDDPERAMDRWFVISIVRSALQRTQQMCETEGLAEHWEVFLRHHYRGEAYADFSGDMGLEPSRAAVMARTVKGKFRAALRDLLVRDGINKDLDAEIVSLMEVTRP